MSESSKQQIARDIDTKTKRLNRTMEDAQAELQQDEQKALQTIYQRMQVVLDKYAKDHGYSLILDVSSQQTPVLFASNGIDVTKDIIDLYDQNTGGAAPAAPAPAKP
jgi:outer membrane protein